jgi:hypothetical protein
MKGQALLQRQGWLLQNQLNPFPISGQLALSDQGHLSFTLDQSSAQCHLGWLEKALGTSNLKERIERGEPSAVFNLPVAGRKIAFPMRLGGYGMTVSDESRSWTVCLNYPSGGASQIFNIIGGRKTSKPWKEALAAGGAQT